MLQAPPKGFNNPYDPRNFDEYYAQEYGGFTTMESGGMGGGRGGGRGRGGSGGRGGGRGMSRGGRWDGFNWFRLAQESLALLYYYCLKIPVLIEGLLDIFGVSIGI